MSGRTVAKTASGPKSNFCTFNSNLIRALNGFSAQPLSAFTVSFSHNSLSQSLSPSPFFPSTVFYLYNYCSSFYQTFFLSLSFSLTYYSYTVSNAAVHLTFFFPLTLSLSCLCHLISSTLSLSITPYLFIFSPILVALTLIFFLNTTFPSLLMVFFPPLRTSQSGGSSFSFFLKLTPLAH